MESKRNEILQLLKQNSVISGEDIARNIGISRTAVWKHIKILQKKGYIIEAIRQKGYHLQSLPDLPLEEIQQRIQTSCIGTNIQLFPTLSSTNEYVKQLAKKEYPEGTVVIAETQTMGRGRKQREWSSPEGGLWFSLLLRPQLPPQKARLVTMATSIAITKAIQSTMGLDVRIKWPNDILYNGRKICGILTELSAEIDQINYMIVGIGINVNNQLPRALQQSATSLKQIQSQQVSLKELFIHLLSSLDTWYDYVKQNNETLIYDTWKSLTDTIGKTVEIKNEATILKGVVKGITETGGLILETRDGTKHVVTGDISYI